MAWKVSSAPGSEPLTRTEVKEWLKVDSDITADDDLIDGLITASRKYAERRTGIALLTQTIQESFDDFPPHSRRNYHGVLQLSVSPVIAVTSLQYKDENGDTQTWAASNYILDTTTKPARISPTYETEWPLVYDEINAVTVTYTAGHAATTDANFPSEVLIAMKLWIAGEYEQRQDRAARYKSASERMFNLVRVAWFEG